MTTSPGSSLIEQLQAVFPPDRCAALDRIVLRAEADAPYATSTIGTGAPSTVKRARAVKLALAGTDTAAIATAVKLSEERIRQVFGNVVEHGLPALYPSFSEQVAPPDGMTSAQLWKLIRPIIESSPSSNGVRAGRWNPPFVLEFLISQGTLEDGSNSQIEDFIKRYLDPKVNLVTFQYGDGGHAPASQNTGLWAYFLLAAAGAGLIALGINGHSIPELIFGFFMTLIMSVLLSKQLLEYRLLRKVLAQKKKRRMHQSPLQTSRRVLPIQRRCRFRLSPYCMRTRCRPFCGRSTRSPTPQTRSDCFPCACSISGSSPPSPTRAALRLRAGRSWAPCICY